MERVQIQALIERQARAWEQRNIEAILSDFAPQALFCSPGGHWQGREEIRAAATAFLATVSEVKVKITRILVDGDQGAVEWSWCETRLGAQTPHMMEDAIIFALQDGQIIYWREYFDPAQMG
jgi:uncharacterized protein (TIGR02246 family)